MIISAKRMGALAVIAALSTSGFAFMNSNTVATSGAGEGSGPVWGYNVNNISYSVVGEQHTHPDSIPGGHGNNPCYSSQNSDLGQICDVSFSLTPQDNGPAAVNVEAALDPHGGGGSHVTWVSCDQTDGVPHTNVTTWDCQFSGPQEILPVDSLEVRATS